MSKCFVRAVIPSAFACLIATWKPEKRPIVLQALMWTGKSKPPRGTETPPGERRREELRPEEGAEAKKNGKNHGKRKYRCVDCPKESCGSDDDGRAHGLGSSKLVPPVRFHLNDHCFYMGHKVLRSSYRKRRNLGGDSYAALWLYGTARSGKPFLLAALVRYPISTGDAVICLPGCRALAKGPVRCPREAMLFGRVDNSNMQ